MSIKRFDLPTISHSDLISLLRKVREIHRGVLYIHDYCQTQYPEQKKLPKLFCNRVEFSIDKGVAVIFRNPVCSTCKKIPVVNKMAQLAIAVLFIVMLLGYLFTNSFWGLFGGWVLFLIFVFSGFSPRTLQSSFAYLVRKSKDILWRNYT